MFIERPRRKPTSVMPASSAISTASDDGADTATRAGTPAITAFWVSSNEARPETMSTVPAAGTFRVSRAWPRTLSTALCRPTSSRTASRVPSAVNRPAPCSPPVESNTFCAARRASGSPKSTSAGSLTGSSAGGNTVRVRTASSEALPHTPHEEVV